MALLESDLGYALNTGHDLYGFQIVVLKNIAQIFKFNPLKMLDRLVDLLSKAFSPSVKESTLLIMSLYALFVTLNIFNKRIRIRYGRRVWV